LFAQLNTLRDPAYDNPVGTVWMTEDGQCYDEMNRNLWVVTFNTLMQVRRRILFCAAAEDANHLLHGDASESSNWYCTWTACCFIWLLSWHGVQIAAPLRSLAADMERSVCQSMIGPTGQLLAHSRARLVAPPHGQSLDLPRTCSLNST
jgi:hypothetical protein